MDNLSSCYFCGTAIDEPLATYLLGENDRGTTVTLCPGCHRKLDTVLDTVNADGTALSTADSAGVATDTDRSSPGPPDSPAASSESADNPLETGADASDILVDPGFDEPIDSDSGPDDPLEEPLDDVDGSQHDREQDRTVTSKAASDESTPGEESDESTPGEESDESTPGEESDESTPGEESDESTPGDQGGEPAGSDENGSGAGTRTGQSTRKSVSALEYNKVMRLLQNREFPVDRDEIETIAASAYDLTRSECAAVIDIAVDRDLIDEEDGQLLRPEQ